MKLRGPSVLLGVLLLIGGVFIPMAKPAATILKARAYIDGAPGSGVSGEALFFQTDDGILPTVRVIIHVSGLAPNSKHGMHIHEVGVCDAPAFATAGGHFDPGTFGNSNPDSNHPFHMGDLEGLTANDAGRATLEYQTSRISLSPGPVSVFDSNGSAIIVHRDPDQGITGSPGSGVGGGPRIACGVIVPSS